LIFFLNIRYLSPFLSHLQKLSVPIKLRHIAQQKSH
jgi:hypothetical protein